MKHYRNYIGGEWVESARTFDDLDPTDGRLAVAQPDVGAVRTL